MTKITLSDEALEAIAIDGIKAIRLECETPSSSHPADIAACKLYVASCDVLLAYLGASVPSDN